MSFQFPSVRSGNMTVSVWAATPINCQFKAIFSLQSDVFSDFQLDCPKQAVVVIKQMKLIKKCDLFIGIQLFVIKLSDAHNYPHTPSCIDAVSHGRYAGHTFDHEPSGNRICNKNRSDCAKYSVDQPFLPKPNSLSFLLYSSLYFSLNFDSPILQHKNGFVQNTCRTPV